jgi:hypothetical protein
LQGEYENHFLLFPGFSIFIDTGGMSLFHLDRSTFPGPQQLTAALFVVPSTRRFATVARRHG